MANYKNSPTSELREDKTPRVSRNWHDRSHRNSTSLPVGRVVPIMCEFLQGNSTVKLDINSAVQTNPTSSPVFGTMSVDIKSVFCALRHYVVGLYGNNLLENDFVEEIAFPLTNYSRTSFAGNGMFYSNFIGHGSLLAHLRYPRVVTANGVRDINEEPVFDVAFPLNKKARVVDLLAPTETGNFASWYTPEQALVGLNAVPILAYIDACLHYCVDPFDRVIPLEQTRLLFQESPTGPTLVVDRTIVGVEYDDLMNFIYESKGFSVPNPLLEDGLTINKLKFESLGDFNSRDDEDGVLVWDGFSLVPRYVSSLYPGLDGTRNADFFECIDAAAQMTFNDGLFPTTFKPDLFTSWYDDGQVNKLMSVQFDNGSYAGLRLAQAEFNRLANNLIKGQTYEDYVDTTYGYNLKMCDHPILVGADSYNIRFQDIVNTAARMGEGVQTVPLGTAVARGYAANRLNKTIHFTSQEPGYLLVLASLVPSVSYTEDVPAHLRFTRLGDTPNRFYDAAGFRNLKLDEAFFTSSIELGYRSIGSQPFYYYNMLSYDRVSGLLATEGFRSYSFIRDFDIKSVAAAFDYADGLDVFFSDAIRSKYVNGTEFDYAFPANAPVSVGEQYEAIANATAQNYYFLFDFDLRVLEPLSNQVIARATF